MFVTIIRTVILYLFVIFALRVMGKRQIGEMQPNELVVTLMISELASMPMQDLTQPIITGVLAICTLILIELVISIVIMKSRHIRRAVVGKPAIVICDGEIDQSVMKALRMTTEDLLEDLRLKGVFDLGDVSYAIVETNGKLSIFLKPEARSVSAGQMSIPSDNSGIPLMVISDGIFQRESLSIGDHSEEDIRKILLGKGISPDEVFIMTINKAGKYCIVGKESAK